ncbi:MAG: hypothetical protein AABZ74_07100 [Cyanobacteriota bacterium]
MSEKNQKSLEIFKLALKDIIEKETKKINHLTPILKTIGDNNLSKYFDKRAQFLNFCTGTEGHVVNINDYKGNEQYLDKAQKDFYLTLDSLKKEALKLMASNQKQWFAKLFENEFDNLKFLLRNLLISENQSDLYLLEKMVQEIELLRYKKK